jgi:hypothetical protein
MTRNQKIALGCGGAGCLGLIVVAVACVLIFYFGWRRAGSTEWYANYNSNSNRNINLNSNDNENNSNSNSDSTNSSSSSDSSSSADAYTEDEKHKLFQAAAMTGDTQLQRRVWVKIGIMNEDYSEGEKFSQFGAEHVAWAVRNYQWMSTMNSEEKGRAYVNEHLR